MNTCDQRATATIAAALQLALVCIFACAILLPASAIELPRGFISETLATNLNAMTAMALPDDGRILLADQTGKLLVWKDGQLLAKPALQIHVTDYWERGLIGLTLHPDFPRTPHLFVLYVTDKPFVHHVLSRFTMIGDSVLPDSKLVLLEGDDQSKLGGSVPAGHQGGPVRFGPDRKLYIAIGEQTAGEPSQKLDTFQGKILRINPDGSIPEDNPFINQTTGKYRAIWAFGVRNPFGLAVQAETGRLFFTDVGGSAFEEVNELIRGANYGWPRAEGYSTQSNFKSPLYAYPPVIGRSICGGVFYPIEPPPTSDSNQSWPDKWRGKFFFVDYLNPWLKALDPIAPTNLIAFASGFNGPIAVDVGPNGSMYVLNRGTIWRDGKRFTANSGSLVRIRYTGDIAPNVVESVTSPSNANPLGIPATAAALPKRWSKLGLLSRLETLANNRRLISYEVNMPEWHPGIDVTRMIALPPGTKIRFSECGDWQFPSGTLFLRSYSTSVFNSGAERSQPIEHRLIVIGEPRSFGASYRITADGTDAELVEDGEMAPLEDRKSHYWFFPPLDDALTFPTANQAYTLDANTRQLNREGADGKNQLLQWSELGLFDTSLDHTTLRTLPRLAALDAPSASVELRVRSYLDVNCAVCHQPGGASRGLFDARFITPLSEAGLINGPLAAGDLGINGARIIVPGDPEKSILYQRLKRNDLFRMPPVQFHNEPSPVLPLMENWIRNLQENSERKAITNGHR